MSEVTFRELASLDELKLAEDVQRQTRQAVGFSGDQTVAVQPVFLRQPVAPALRLLQAADEEIDIDAFISVKRPDASADLRGGGIRAAG